MTSSTATTTKHPCLYKRNQNGSIQYWEISVTGADIRTNFGQLGTLHPQISTETIKSGKNLGQINQTSAEEQARLDAKSRWTKRVEREGYTPDLEKAKAGERENDFPIPMLAHTWDKAGHKMTFPMFGQPKLDGIRCLAEKRDGKVTLYSRKGKEFTGIPHINRALEAGPDFDILDGELYNHKYKDNFEFITHLVKQQHPCKGSEEVEFHIFDVVKPGPFSLRFEWVKDQGFDANPSLKIVETVEVETNADIEDLYDRYADDNYEGVILREKKSPYEPKRSYGLQKFKKFVDDEFEIVNVVEGRGRLAGHGIFVCVTVGGTEFHCKMEGPIENLKAYWERPTEYIGKALTTQYQGISNKSKVPRFPVGKSIRDYE